MGIMSGKTPHDVHAHLSPHCLYRSPPLFVSASATQSSLKNAKLASVSVALHLPILLHETLPPVGCCIIYPFYFLS